LAGGFRAELTARLGTVAHLTVTQLERLEKHYELLCRWNERLNLTAISGELEIIERHYCESLFLGAHLPEGRLRVADIGSGAGFPGFPVAVLRPECQVSLIESHQRKSVFLKESSRGLGNVRVIAKRAEDVTEPFDWVICRAVRYSDIAATAARLAPEIALLTAQASEGALKLPWGTKRYLSIRAT